MSGNNTISGNNTNDSNNNNTRILKVWLFVEAVFALVSFGIKIFVYLETKMFSETILKRSQFQTNLHDSKAYDSNSSYPFVHFNSTSGHVSTWEAFKKHQEENKVFFILNKSYFLVPTIFAIVLTSYFCYKFYLPKLSLIKNNFDELMTFFFSSGLFNLISFLALYIIFAIVTSVSVDFRDFYSVKISVFATAVRYSLFLLFLYQVRRLASEEIPIFIPKRKNDIYSYPASSSSTIHSIRNKWSTTERDLTPTKSNYSLSNFAKNSTGETSLALTYGDLVNNAGSTSMGAFNRPGIIINYDEFERNQSTF
ncbi:hypothetical protein HK099_006281 [Clydaea vesicula]|uniref:Uncharacterized protein n=1 Tax=Clydaea vesicula TaxID=447962 RepID=A0AAD5XX27_9FUNG|nr:hypothetical protein HK099_006281 [Clydaea vesicula]